MTAEEAIELLYDIQTDAVYNVLSSEKEALEMAIKALEQQPCEDCISREATIEAIYKKYIGGKGAIENAPINDLYAEGLAEAVDAVWDMPSVTPKAKVGRWINLEETKYKGQVLPFWGRYECSKCGGHGEGTFNYCPNCGARMEEGEE